MPTSRLVAAAAAALCVVLALVIIVPRLTSSSEPDDARGRPAVVKSIEDLGELKSATANLQIVVELENRDDDRWPRWLRGSRTLFIAAGTVDASVDLRAINPEELTVSQDGRTATIVLPKAVLSPARLDTEQSRVYDTDRGLLDRLQEAAGSLPADPQPLYAEATRQLDEAAAADPQLRIRAEQNAISTLTGLLRGLGFTDVQVTIRDGGTSAEVATS
ncbi:hypothetical protein BJY21_001974 [Kineosphaera limosa]|nr:DUF4230 domain-containing protein [Kineosphaera limosa]NYE00790.1 hypothetical protein [Kineosphaera limosa]